MNYDFTSYIAEYDEMLLLDKENLSGWRFSMVDPNISMEDEREIDEIKKEMALTICRHVIEDHLGWTPEDAIDRFGPKVAEFYRLDKVLCTHDRAKERIPSYGFCQFASLATINYHYLLSLMYPNLLFLYGTYSSRFSYAKEALQNYLEVEKAKHLAARGGSTAQTKIPKTLFSNISLQDDVSTMCEFLRYFVNYYCKDDIGKSERGRAYDVYRFFANNYQVDVKVKAAGLESVLAKRSLSYYDLICDYAEAVIPKDDLFYRKVFSYVGASSIAKDIKLV